MHGILGGGLSGLAAAYYLLKTSQPVKLFEASQRLGGWIRSSRTESGHIFEHGPRTIRPKGEQGENTLQLISELGLSQRVVPIPFNHPAAQNRMIYVNKHLYTLPSSFLSLVLVKPPFTKPLISALLHDLRAPKKAGSDESIYDFVQRRLGQELADYAISPMICGICAGDAKQISVKFLMKSLYEAEQEHGSIIGGMLKNMWMNRGSKKKAKNKNELCERAKKEKWSVYSLQGGLELLPQTLEEQIRSLNGSIMLNAPCENITFVDSKTVSVKSRGRDFIVQKLISSIPAPKLAPLLQKQHPELSKELAAIPFVTVGVVNLQYPGKLVKKDAFGFLVPPSQNIPILGVIFDSCCFPSADNTLLTVMMGGHWFEKQFGRNPSRADLLNIATSQVKSILGISDKPQNSCVSILKDCIPQYVLGHHDRVKRIRDYISAKKLPLAVIGASYDGVGVNDVILSARRAAENV
ncbi:protoporphyrinogen oxidase [Anabrus simplex]|uniref:protoporphyrinogen oxidase n=1 Tax=Anabrus simplex TaxID=316456 RepID=UPI0034DD8778